jgi:hypothetical protein
MRRVVLGTVLSIFALSLMGQNQALGSLCGVSRCCHSTCCTPCCQNCCIVMQTCQETVYEYQEMTAYEIVYEDVATPVKVPCVEYAPAPRPTCVPDTVLVPPAPSACPPAAPMPSACPPAATCAPCAGPTLVPMNICRKVTLEGYRPVNAEKPDVIKRVVARQVPYQVTLCIPHIVTKQVPVKVCCPACCCSCTSPAPAAQGGCAGCGK